MDSESDLVGRDEKVVRLLRLRWYMVTTLAVAALALVGLVIGQDWGLAAADGVIIGAGLLSLAHTYKRL